MTKKITVNIGTPESPQTVEVVIDRRTRAGQEYWNEVEAGSIIAPEEALKWLTRNTKSSPPHPPRKP